MAVEREYSPLPVIAPVATTDPDFEPISLDQAKYQVQVASGTTAHDDQLQRLIVYARRLVESETGWIAATQSFTWKLYEWPTSSNPILLPVRNVTSITSIAYRDTAGDAQTWSSAEYRLELGGLTPAIYKLADYDWPTVESDYPGPITITYVAGAATVDAIPDWFTIATQVAVADAWGRKGRSELFDNLIRQQLSGYELA